MPYTLRQTKRVNYAEQEKIIHEQVKQVAQYDRKEYHRKKRESYKKKIKEIVDRQKREKQERIDALKEAKRLERQRKRELKQMEKEIEKEIRREEKQRKMIEKEWKGKAYSIFDNHDSKESFVRALKSFYQYNPVECNRVIELNPQRDWIQYVVLSQTLALWALKNSL